MSKVIEINNKEEYSSFKTEHRRGVIFYGATWCEACEEIKPLYTRIANRYFKRIAMAYVDIDVCGLDFTSVPVFVSFRKGNQLNSMEGASERELKMFIKHAIEFESNSIAPKQMEKGEIKRKESKRKTIKKGETIKKEEIIKRDTGGLEMEIINGGVQTEEDNIPWRTMTAIDTHSENIKREEAKLIDVKSMESKLLEIDAAGAEIENKFVNIEPMKENLLEVRLTEYKIKGNSKHDENNKEVTRSNGSEFKSFMNGPKEINKSKYTKSKPNTHARKKSNDECSCHGHKHNYGEKITLKGHKSKSKDRKIRPETENRKN